ncbi:M23 family metallopeptidase [Geobacter pickeringii]|uniref:Peptidase M23 n=1 Tax=Geobacter pickeringii TaxID=345632 RepID=A0A0B5B8M6_9BACT|nr:M23 family metallopeptidase [Geobacter pickeringii]AJE03053.1 peptidase M23 [Geobacter pickeringii]
MKTLLRLSLFTLLAVPAVVRADIYRYVDNDGVECFTDAPRTGGATLVMKERDLPRPRTTRSVPRHLAATGIVEKATVTAPAPATSPAAAELPVHGRITSLVGLRHDPIDGTLREHNGVDIAVPQGTAVHPIAAGKVLFSGTRPGYGNIVIIEHGDGTITLYGHHAKNLVSVGEEVSGATIIALSGSTGRSTGPHLHFEAWRDGKNVTTSYIPGAAGEGVGTADVRRQAQDTIRRIVQSDGSLVFTNLH